MALLAATVIYLVALGLASLAGSRSATVAIVLAWQFAVTPLALAAAKLGVVREGLLTAALDRVIPAGLLPGARPEPGQPRHVGDRDDRRDRGLGGHPAGSRRMADHDPGRVTLTRRYGG